MNINLKLYVLDGTAVLALTEARARTMYRTSFGRLPVLVKRVPLNKEGYVAGERPGPLAAITIAASAVSLEAEVLSLRKQGKTYEQIGRQTGISPSSAFNITKDANPLIPNAAAKRRPFGLSCKSSEV